MSTLPSIYSTSMNHGTLPYLAATSSSHSLSWTALITPTTVLFSAGMIPSGIVRLSAMPAVPMTAHFTVFLLLFGISLNHLSQFSQR